MLKLPAIIVAFQILFQQYTLADLMLTLILCQYLHVLNYVLWIRMILLYKTNLWRTSWIKRTLHSSELSSEKYFIVGRDNFLPLYKNLLCLTPIERFLEGNQNFFLKIKKAYGIHLKDFIFHIVIDLKTYIICVFSSVCRAMFQLSRLVVQASSETELLKKELWTPNLEGWKL